jgi:hypothetical protein
MNEAETIRSGERILSAFLAGGGSSVTAQPVTQDTRGGIEADDSIGFVHSSIAM